MRGDRPGSEGPWFRRALFTACGDRPLVPGAHLVRILFTPHAGIDRRVDVIKKSAQGLPVWGSTWWWSSSADYFTACGDRPYPLCQNPPRGLFTRMRGSTLDGVTPFKSGAVYPHAGDRQELYRKQKKQAVYPACEDRPFIHVFHGFLSCLPHANRTAKSQECRYAVYPHAGIDL